MSCCASDLLTLDEDFDLFYQLLTQFDCLRKLWRQLLRSSIDVIGVPFNCSQLFFVPGSGFCQFVHLGGQIDELCGTWFTGLCFTSNLLGLL